MDTRTLNFLFIQTHHLHFRRAHARFGEVGLAEGQPRFIRHLSEEDGLSQAELGRRCHLEPSTVTTMLSRMEKRNLVERRPDGKDRRVTRVWLTDEGRDIHRALERLGRELAEECFEGFDAEDRVRMAGYLGRMRDNMMRAEGGVADLEVVP